MSCEPLHVTTALPSQPAVNAVMSALCEHALVIRGLCAEGNCARFPNARDGFGLGEALASGELSVVPLCHPARVVLACSARV
jgi:hypothetical protein